MIRQDGTPKILDFGLAHIERGESVPLDSDMPTMTMDSDVPPSLTQGKGFMGYTILHVSRADLGCVYVVLNAVEAFGSR